MVWFSALFHALSFPDLFSFLITTAEWKRRARVRAQKKYCENHSSVSQIPSASSERDHMEREKGGQRHVLSVPFTMAGKTLFCRLDVETSERDLECVTRSVIAEVVGVVRPGLVPAIHLPDDDD